MARYIPADRHCLVCGGKLKPVKNTKFEECTRCMEWHGESHNLPRKAKKGGA